MLVEAGALAGLLQQLSATSGSERLRYWVSPVKAEGHLPLPPG